jgi:tetratricopeptide (TPR) repeat protein
MSFPLLTEDHGMRELFVAGGLLVLTSVLATGGPATAQDKGYPEPVRPELPTDIFRDRAAQAGQDFERLVRERLRSKSSISGFKLTEQEKSALRKLENAASRGSGPATRELEEARAVAQSPDALFVLGALELQLGAKATDSKLQYQGTDRVIDSGAAPAAILPRLYRNQGIFALNENNLPKAELAFAKLVQINPANAEAAVTLAQVKNDLGKHKEALQLFEQAISAQKSANAAVPDIWVRAANSTRAKVTARAN